MNRKQKIIISVTGIFLVALILVGLTYAYFLTQITGNTNPKSISVTTANLQLLYTDGTNIIFDENTKLVPSNTQTYTKTFTVFNDGDSKVENYNVYLENVANELERKDDLVYTLICSSDDTTNSPCTNQITSETTFPSTNGTILKNSIDVGDTHTYTLTLKYKEMNVDQSIDMNKYVNAKVNIYDNNGIDKLTFEYYLMNDTRIVKNTTTPTFNSVETNEVGMYSAEDDYGTSWYFRGAQSYNYVNFAGFTWRIVRINGDGSIRLILDGTLDKVKNVGESNYVYQNIELQKLDNDGRVFFNYIDPSVENQDKSDNAFIGYMYGSVPSTSYDIAHKNINSSNIKLYVEKFYEQYLIDYQSFLADTLFCGDKSLASNFSSDNSGYGLKTSTYSINDRLNSPTFECAKNITNTYSRYTSRIDMSDMTLKGVKLNNDLTYPIGLFTVDEIIFAGGYIYQENNSYYLSDAARYETTTLSNWFTINSGILNTIVSYAPLHYASSTDGSFGTNSMYSEYGVRPVINLRADSIVSGGEGTYKSPYRIEEID